MDKNRIALSDFSKENLGILKAALSILVDHIDRSNSNLIVVITVSALSRAGLSKPEFFQILNLANEISGKVVVENAEKRRSEHSGFHILGNKALEGVYEVYGGFDGLNIGEYAFAVLADTNTGGNLKKLLSEIQLILDKKSSTSSDDEQTVKIFIDRRNGIYIDMERRYGISGKRFDCVFKLIGSDLTQEEISEFWSTPSQISHEIKTINRLVKKSLRIEYDLIVHSKTSRTYSLNREELQIVSS